MNAKARHFEAALRAHRAGAFLEAEARYRRLLAKDKRAIGPLTALGLLLIETDRAHEAVEPLARRARIAPDADSLFALATAKAKSGDTATARQILDDLLRVAPAHVPALNNAGGLAFEDGAADRAAMYFAMALSLCPDYGGLIANLARALDVLGLGAWPWASRAADLGEVQAMIAAARVAPHPQRRAQITRLGAMIATDLPADLAASARFVLAALLDDPVATPKLLAEAHQAAARTRAFRAARKRHVLDLLDAAEARATPSRLAGLSTAQSFDDDAPVFLVGFPRSGTTLIERLLVGAGFVTSGERSPLAQALAEGESDLAACRDAYDRAWPAHGRRRLDKLPFNLVHLDRIAEVWPDARVVAMLRDPHDSVWSSYGQDFAWNDLTVHFADLDSAVRLAERFHALWLRFEGHLAQHRLVLRYEDVVTDPPHALGRLEAFLGVDLTIGNQAAPGAIWTPSRNRARAGIDTDAVGRWQRFAATLAPWRARLGDLASRLGYPCDLA